MTLPIIMPCHHHPALALPAIASVIAQTYGDWALIVGLNNYDPERTTFYDDLRLMSRLDGRVYFVDLPEMRHYIPVAKHLVTLASRFGDRVALMESDDLWHPEKLARQVPLLECYDVVGTGGQYFGEDKRGQIIDVPEGEISRQCFAVHNPIINQSAILWLRDAEWDDEYVEGAYDYELWCRLSARGSKFFNVPESLVLHRLHAASAYNTRHLGELCRRIRSRYFPDQ